MWQNSHSLGVWGGAVLVSFARRGRPAVEITRSVRALSLSNFRAGSLAWRRVSGGPSEPLRLDDVHGDDAGKASPIAADHRVDDLGNVEKCRSRRNCACQVGPSSGPEHFLNSFHLLFDMNNSLAHE